MAKRILRDCFIEVNGVDLSDHFSQIEVNETSDEQDVTGFQATAKEKLLGIGDDTITGTLFQDNAEGSVDATLAPLQGSNTPFDVIVRADAAAKSATNPQYEMEALLPNYKPLSGQVGAPSTTDVNFINGGPNGIERVTA